MRKTITFDETLILDAEFVAKYQEKTFAGYVRHCVRMETQKRLKAIEKVIGEELHVNMPYNQPQRSGNAIGSNSELRQLVHEMIKEASIAGENTDANE